MTEPKESSKFEAAEEALKKFTTSGIRVAIMILLGVAAWRLAWSDFTLDLSKFDFSDLLALILALFAVGMSVAFYFKSTDSSNQFYDNIYNFTQKTSEILGRIEERFGEQFKHLDAGYGRIESRLDGISKSPGEIEEKVKETEGKEEEEKQKLEKTNAKMRDILESLTKRAKMQQQEKDEFYKELAKLSEEKDLAQERIREIEEDRDKMQQQLMLMERDMHTTMRGFNDPALQRFLRNPEMRNILMHDAPLDLARKHVSSALRRYPSKYIHELREYGILNDNDELTTAGFVTLKSIFRRNMRRNSNQSE